MCVTTYSIAVSSQNRHGRLRVGLMICRLFVFSCGLQVDPFLSVYAVVKGCAQVRGNVSEESRIMILLRHFIYYSQIDHRCDITIYT